MKQQILRKYCLAISVLALLSLLLIGCRNEEEIAPEETQGIETLDTSAAPHVPVATTEGQVIDTTPVTEPSATIKESAPSINQVANDLLYLNCNYFSLDGIDTCLNINNLQLEHIQQGIPCDNYRYRVEYGNDFYKVDAVYNLNYVYDGEFWVLVNWVLDSSKSCAIKSQIDQNKVIENCERRFDSYELTSHDYWTDENGVFTDVITFQGTLESKYFTEVFVGTYTYTFVNALSE